MRASKLVFVLITAVFATSTYAAPPAKAPQDVNVVNTPGVTIENSDINPIPVTSKAFTRIPFKLTGTFSFGTDVFADVTMNPPADRTVVIEMVTAYFTLDNDDPVRSVSLFTAPEGKELSAFILQPPHTGSALITANDHIVSQQVRLYSASGWPVIFRVERNSTSLDNRTGVVRISGYTVPVDSPTLSP